MKCMTKYVALDVHPHGSCERMVVRFTERLGFSESTVRPNRLFPQRLTASFA